MAPVQLLYVVSFTSQDNAHKANNLLRGEGGKKWLVDPKDRSGKIEIVFQLEQPCHFSYIDIGTLWCASLEVRVGRSDWPLGDEFKTLIPLVNLMSPIDCQLGRKTTSTSMFSKSSFSSDAAAEQWDRIQIIGRQPYRKDMQLGISFVRIRNSADSALTKTPPENKSHVAKKLHPTSASSIKKHFFGESKENEDDRADALKYKLLQISNSSADSGSEVIHQEALSRTAQLVLKAAEAGQNSTKHYKLMAKQSRRGLFSGSVVGKDHVKINEEIASFLQTLRINLDHLESITIADLRHKFERHKRRKLTPGEKRIFSSECQSYICKLVEQSNKMETSRMPLQEDHTVSARLGAPQCISANMDSMTLSPKQSLTNESNEAVKTSLSFKRSALLSKSKDPLKSSVGPNSFDCLSSPKVLSPTCDSSPRTSKTSSSSAGPHFKKTDRFSPYKRDSGGASGTSKPCEITTVSSSTPAMTNSTSSPGIANISFDSAVLQRKVHVELGKEENRSKDEFEGTKSKNIRLSGLPKRNNKTLGKKKKNDTLFRSQSDEEEEGNSEDDDDALLCSSNISFDEEDKTGEMISPKRPANALKTISPLKSHRGRTLQEINDAYASLYSPMADSLPPKQKNNTSEEKVSQKKNKKLSKNTMNLIQSFVCEISDEDDVITATGAKEPSSFSPWLGKTNDVIPLNKTSVTKNATDEQKVSLKKDKQNGKQKAPRNRTAAKKFTFSAPVASHGNDLVDGNSSMTSFPVNSKIKTFKFQPVNPMPSANASLTSTGSSSLFAMPGLSKSHAGSNGFTWPANIHRANSSHSKTTFQSQAPMTLCPFCDLLVPNETYDAHMASCVNNAPSEVDEPAGGLNEATIDADEEFGDCPICQRRFEMSVLAVHASECGLY